MKALLFGVYMLVSMDLYATPRVTPECRMFSTMVATVQEFRRETGMEEGGMVGRAIESADPLRLDLLLLAIEYTYLVFPATSDYGQAYSITANQCMEQEV